MHPSISQEDFFSLYRKLCDGFQSDEEVPPIYQDDLKILNDIKHSSGIYFCSPCQQFFEEGDAALSLLDHMHQKHSQSVKLESKSVFYCFHCSIICSSVVQAHNHVRFIHETLMDFQNGKVVKVLLNVIEDVVRSPTATSPEEPEVLQPEGALIIDESEQTDPHSSGGKSGYKENPPNRVERAPPPLRRKTLRGSSEAKRNQVSAGLPNQDQKSPEDPFPHNTISGCETRQEISPSPDLTPTNHAVSVGDFRKEALKLNLSNNLSRTAPDSTPEKSSSEAEIENIQCIRHSPLSSASFNQREHKYRVIGYHSRENEKRVIHRLKEKEKEKLRRDKIRYRFEKLARLLFPMKINISKSKILDDAILKCRMLRRNSQKSNEMLLKAKKEHFRLKVRRKKLLTEMLSSCQDSFNPKTPILSNETIPSSGNESRADEKDTSENAWNSEVIFVIESEENSPEEEDQLSIQSVGRTSPSLIIEENEVAVESGEEEEIIYLISE